MSQLHNIPQGPRTSGGPAGPQSAVRRSRVVQARESPLYRLHAPPIPEDATLARLVAADPAARRVRQRGVRPAFGELVGVRLNLDILRTTGVPVLTVHRGTSVRDARTGQGYWSGEEVWYELVVTLRNAFFSVDQAGRERIARGAPKQPVASVDGELARGHKFQGIELRFNPARVHLFVDANGDAVRWAEEVTVCGHRVYARGAVEYHDPTTAPARRPGSAPSQAHLRAA